MSERFYIRPDVMELMTDGSADKANAARETAQNINRILSALQTRLDKIEKVSATVNGKITSFAVEGRQGLFHLTWNRVDDADGFIIEMYSDSAGAIRLGRWDELGGQRVQWQLSVGNAAITRYFRITPFAGNSLGTPSAIVGDTSDSFGAGEADPATPPVDPSPPSDTGGSGRTVYGTQ